MRLLLSTLVLAFGLSAHADPDKVFSCKGVKGYHGTLSLVLTKTTDGYDYGLKGTYTFQDPEDASYNVGPTAVDCSGTRHNGKGAIKAFDYYTAGAGTCPYSYVRTKADGLYSSESGGLIYLVTAGPSDHDDSGYRYDVFYCDPQ